MNAERMRLEGWPTFLILLTVVAGVVLVGLQEQTLGWALLGITTALTLARAHPIRRHLPLVLGALGLLGLTPINTSIESGHILLMSATLSLAVWGPYVVSKFVYRDGVIRFPFHHGRSWYKKEVAYIGISALIAYMVLPFYLVSTGSYHNWTVEPGVGNLILLFIGTNALGIWDELFFVSTVLAVFRRYMPFWWANVAQALLWVAFLYELGFRGWGPLPIFIFALIQGYVFRRTDSLLYIITIHLTIDLILYLALIHASYPDWLSIFVI